MDDWDVSSAADTASTAASTVEVVPCGAKGGARAWELALEQAAVVAKRLPGGGRMRMLLEVFGLLILRMDWLVSNIISWIEIIC